MMDDKLYGLKINMYVSQDQLMTLTNISGDSQATFTSSFGAPKRAGELAFTFGACRGDTSSADIAIIG